MDENLIPLYEADVSKYEKSNEVLLKNCRF
jgi:hypothetical protein